MSLYSDSGRYRLANWFFNCLYIDLLICGFLLYLNLPAIIVFFQANPREIVIIAICFLVYLVITIAIKEKLLKYRDDIWRQLFEVVASIYFFIHVVLYFLIIGIFLSTIYLDLTRIQVSSDFLISWAIILGVLILVGFYLKNKEYQRSSGTESERIHTDPRWDYPDGHLSKDDCDIDENEIDIPVIRETEEQRFQREQYRSIRETQAANIPIDLHCFVCGKRDILPIMGSDGRYYCRDHILPENRNITSNYHHSKNNSAPQPDIHCKNTHCRKEIYHKDVIQCGPCGQLFCKHCWEEHRWSHGKSPAVGISYTADGTFSGFDGTESMRK